MSNEYRMASKRFFCHSCNTSFSKFINLLNWENIYCPNCNQEFVEEITEETKNDFPLLSNSPQSSSSNQNSSPLPSQESNNTTGQNRRRAFPVVFSQTITIQRPNSQPETITIMNANGPVSFVPLEDLTSQNRQNSQQARVPPFLLPFFPFNLQGGNIDSNILADIIERSMAERGNSSNPTPDDVLKTIPVFELDENHCSRNQQGEIELPKCSICIEDINLKERTMKLPCNHHYHENCITTWLKQHNTCPVCRHSLSEINHNHDQNSNNNQFEVPMES